MTTERIVFIGGDAAGMAAAALANRRRDRERTELVVFERGDYTSYAACGLPYFVGGLVEGPDRLIARSPEAHRAKGIDVRVRHEVRAIDLDRRELEVASLDDRGSVRREPFDRLVVATGAVPIRPPFPNVDARGVTGIHTIPDALALDEMLRTRSPARAVVVGGGYIGLEMVEALLLRGLHVTLVEKLPQPLATLDPDMGALVTRALCDVGVDVRLGVGVEGFEMGGDGWVTAVATDAGVVPADVVVLGLGIRPNVGLAQDAGITIGPSGAVAADAGMRTSAEGVWVAGDAAESRHRVSGAPVSVALGTHANQQGRVVGTNVTGGDATFPGVLGTAVTKLCDTEIARTGLNEREARAAGVDTVAEITESRTRAGYYPGAAPIAVKVLAERTSGRMLGAQIVGGSGSAKRIDAVAVGIWNEMTTDEFSQVDLGYAPPFSAPLDPVLVAARRAGAGR
jgi:NADPH-dependent 2,4-dienoyl-CoA reductase/sulfur reductase-like enzyme